MASDTCDDRETCIGAFHRIAAENDRKRVNYASIRNVLSKYGIVVSLSYHTVTKDK